MKTIPCFAVCALFSLVKAQELVTDAAPSERHIMSEYFKFVAEYGRSHASKDQMDHRYNIFKDKYLMIQAHNSSVDSDGRAPPFMLAINEFADQSEQELLEKYTGGAKPKAMREQRKKRLEAYKPPFNPFEVVDEDALDTYHTPLVPIDHLPSHKNWFKENMVTKPGKQAGCGSCWAFSTAATLESLAMISGTEPTGKLQEYSVQQLVDCDPVNLGCQGGWMYDGYDYVSKQGILLKQDYNMYVASKRKCDRGALKYHYKNKSMEELDGMNNDQIKQRIIQQPIGVAIVSTGMLFSYSHGVVTEDFLKCSDKDKEVNHGVVLVGYGKVDKETVRGHCSEYWIVRNSWGATWGENGFFKLCMDGAGEKGLEFGTCHVNEYGTWPTV